MSLDNQKQKKESTLRFPYRGTRGAFYVYHPAKHGSLAREGLFEECLERFHTEMKDFIAVCKFYNEETAQSGHKHEKVGSDHWQKEVNLLLRAIEKDGKDIYTLEALSEHIFDFEDRTVERVLPTHKELIEKGKMIRWEDSGLKTPQYVDPKAIIKRTWAS